MREGFKYTIFVGLLAILLTSLGGGLANALSRKPTMLHCGHEDLFVLDEYNPGFLLLRCKDSRRKYVITLVDE